MKYLIFIAAIIGASAWGQAEPYAHSSKLSKLERRVERLEKYIYDLQSYREHWECRLSYKFTHSKGDFYGYGNSPSNAMSNAISKCDSSAGGNAEGATDCIRAKPICSRL